MAPKIGITSKVFSPLHWVDEVQKSAYNVIEINRRDSMAPFSQDWIDGVKPLLKRFDLSLHSGTVRLFHDNPQFTETETSILKAEVLMAEALGAKEIIVHLRPKILRDDEVETFRDIVADGVTHGVDIVYESNSKLDEHVTLDVLERIPELNYNLDFGHLNRGIHHGLVKDVDRFLAKVKDRTVYVHCHNNLGAHDSHDSLANGTLDWKRVLAALDMKRVKKIIMENRTWDAIEKSKNALDAYFKR